MIILPVAYDSLGVRSMATIVKTDDLCVFIDPSVALAPRRYGLKPTNEELKALNFCRKNIIELSKNCDVIFVSHYHYDHIPRPNDNEMYEKIFSGKIVFAKDPYHNIHPSGSKRGRLFEKMVKEIADELHWADNSSYECLTFSPPVWHGATESKVGKVIMVSIKDESNFTFIHGSDAQSLVDLDALSWIKSKNPDIVILDGYPTYLLGNVLSDNEFNVGSSNLLDLLSSVKAKTIILDHHILRDLNYKEKITALFERARKLKKNLYTAAEYIGMPNLFLEAHRQEIFNKKLLVDVDNYYKILKQRLDRILELSDIF
ncbi:MAG: MBL fold metallo-hydrolase [Candidatus Asgardarchaeia archaeon]